MSAGQPDADDNWYLARNGQQRGPYTFPKLLEAARNDGILKTDLIWRPGWDAWHPAETVSELFAQTSKAAATLRALSNPEPHASVSHNSTTRKTVQSSPCVSCGTTFGARRSIHLLACGVEYCSKEGATSNNQQKNWVKQVAYVWSVSLCDSCLPKSFDAAVSGHKEGVTFLAKVLGVGLPCAAACATLLAIDFYYPSSGLRDALNGALK
jgi:hypothetical protein